MVCASSLVIVLFFYLWFSLVTVSQFHIFILINRTPKPPFIIGI